MEAWKLGLMALAGAAQMPQAAPQLAEIETALDAHDGRRAATLVHELAVSRRSEDGTLQVDPLVSGLIGRLNLSLGYSDAALPYLERGLSADLPERQRIETLFALAEARRLNRNPTGAAELLHRLEGETLDAGQRARLRLAQAEITIETDPRAALAAVQPLIEADDPAVRFEAELLRSRAHAFLGERAAAAESAGRAWSLAPGVPAYVRAPVRAALLHAALAADAGDEEKLSVMLNAARASAVEVGDVGAMLPVCGEGLAPSDYVTFGAFSGYGVQGQVIPLAASRAQAVAPFARALTGRSVLQRQNFAPAGTVFTVRCRTLPGSGWRPAGQGDAFARIFAEHGIYVLPFMEWDAERVAAIEEEIARLEAARGREHPALIPLLMELQARMMPRLAVADSADPSAAEEIGRRGRAALRRLPGAEPFVPDESELRARMVAATSATQFQAAWRAAMREQIRRLPIDEAYEAAIRWNEGDEEMSDADQRGLVEELLQRFDPARPDPRRRSLLIRLADEQRSAGEYEAAARTVRAVRAPGDTCFSLMDGIRPIGGEMRADDYPVEAIRYELAGRSLIEFGVAADGSVSAQRLLVSAPSLLFDEAAARGFGTYRFTASREGRRLRPCGGVVQPLMWRLPGVEEQESPNPGMPLSERF